MSRVILDTNVLIGLVDMKDKWHTRAMDLMKRIDERELRVLFLDCIVAEAISVLCKRLEEKGRLDEIAEILENIEGFAKTEEIIWVSAHLSELYDDIKKLIVETTGLLNFNDALVALAAREMSVSSIVSFDQDFDKVEWLVRIEDEADLEKVGQAEA